GGHAARASYLQGMRPAGSVPRRGRDLQGGTRLMIPDYQAIRADNEPRYGTEWGRIGPMLLANRYADRTHFIFELLQNAEDALARRAGWQGSRAVTFHLTESALRVSHFGHPFNDAD